MESLQHQQYEYARRRIRQKRHVFLHFMLFLVGSIFIFLINKVLNVGEPDNWYIWAITGWGFIFILHFVKVFITDRFMGKNWERNEIDRLVGMQQKRVEKLQSDAEKRNSTEI